jgi:hypothetical protein
MRPASEKRQGTKSQSGTRAEVAYREVTRVEILCQPGVSRSIRDPRAGLAAGLIDRSRLAGSYG